MLNGPFSDWPMYTQEEAKAIQEVLLSNKVNYWTGDNGVLFEQEFSQFIGSKYAVAVANGTVALDLALKTLSLKHDDEVIVTSRTFIASVSSIVNAGATPVFVDVDRNTQNITSKTILPAITRNTKAIICVHLAGWPCDMDPIMALADQFNLTVIEDCAQAHGALYKGRAVGTIGHIGAWSFCQDKIMTTGGDGGMVTTNDEVAWRKMWAYKDHGKSWDAVFSLKHPPGFRWLHETFGTNWRMTEIQAIIGRIQLKRLNDWNDTRRKYAERIWDTAKQCKSLRVPFLNCSDCSNRCDRCVHAAYKCYVFVKGEASLRDSYIKALNERSIPCQSGSCSEVYLEKSFNGTTFRPSSSLPIAKELERQV